VNHSLHAARWRSALVPTLVATAAIVVAIVLRRPLVAWFSGQPIGGSGGQPVVVHAGSLTVEARLAPDPPRQRDQALVLTLRDDTGQAVDDATVDVTYDMPAMGSMAEMKGAAKVTHEGEGVYRAQFDLPMASTWGLRASVRTGSRFASQAFRMTVGSAGLTLSGGGGAEAVTPSSPGAIDHYTCSMHPSVKQSTPGTCPICGMGLVAVTKEQQERGVVLIDEARRQLIGVRTEPVLTAPMRAMFRAVGHVTYDESALFDVNLKVHGWITKLYVSETGQRVSKGQPLFTIYSPELYNAEQDFLIDIHGSEASAAAGDSADAPLRTELLAHAARQRLDLLGLTDAQIDALGRSGQPSQDLAIDSPASGFVIEKNVVEGASVDAGMRLYRIASLSKVWVDADVYESDLARVRVGQPATVTLDYLPGRSYEAKVAFVYPYLDPTARTGRVRLELANKGLDLRPGMYASVTLSSDLGTRVQVPAAAVVYTGPRRLVFVDIGSGRFRPTEVQVGTESNGMYEVLGGLAQGQQVATSGVFLIAAEARISTAAKYWDSTNERDAGEPPEPSEAMPRAPEPTSAPVPPIPSKSGNSHDPGGGVPEPAPMPMKMPAPERIPAAPAPARTPPATSASVVKDFACPMHPEIHSRIPGKCPKCGMDLVPPPGQP